MTLKQLTECDVFDIAVMPQVINTEKEISGVFVGDMLSHVMSHAKKGNVWITVTASRNTVAVAVLREMPCVIIADGIVPEKDVALCAMEHGICMLTCRISAFDAAVRLNALNDDILK